MVAFGDDPVMADRLVALVLAGEKRATASLLRDFAIAGVKPPVVGDHVVLVDGRRRPRCIRRTSEVRIGPLTSVSDDFARDEGEGERSRDWRLAAHRRYFGRQAARAGFAFHDDIEVVFERFVVVWPTPVSLADRGVGNGE